MVADDQSLVRAVEAHRLVVVSSIGAAFRECRSATRRVASERSRRTELADEEAARRGLAGPKRNHHTIFPARARISPWTSRRRQYDASTAGEHVHPRPGEIESRAQVDHGQDQTVGAPCLSAVFEVLLLARLRSGESDRFRPSGIRDSRK